MLEMTKMAETGRMIKSQY